MSDFATWIERNKGLWTRVFDEVIAPDFEKEWKKREEEFKNELKQRDENQQLLFNHISEQIVKNARVVEENERLETELQQRAESTAPSTDLEGVTATSTAAEEEHRDLAGKYDELIKKYQTLSQKVKYLEKKNNAVMQKNRDMKDSVRAWQHYANSKKPAQKLKGDAAGAGEGMSRPPAAHQNDEAPPHIPSSPISVSTARTPLARADRGCSSSALGVLLTDPEVSHGAAPYEAEERSPSASLTPKGQIAVNSTEHQGITHGNPLLNAGFNGGGQLQANTNEAPSSSQTTVDEGADHANLQVLGFDAEDEDDLPQVVSERSLKRKRGQKPRIDVYTGRFSDGTPAKPHRVKDEPLSSPPPAMHALMRTETIDLDDPAPNDIEAANTMQRDLSMHLNTTTNGFHHQRSSSAPFSQAVKRESTQKDNKARDQLSNVQARLQVAAADMRALSEPTDPHLNDQHVLQPLDANIIAQTPDRKPKKRLKQAVAQRAEHDIIAESGEAHPPLDENELRLPPSAARARFNQRVRAIKNPQTPANRVQRNSIAGSLLVKQEQLPTPPASTPRPAQTSSGLSASRRSTPNPRSNQQQDIVPDGRPVWNMRVSEKRSGARKRNTSPSDRQSRLRLKPVKELTLHDFKPNPAYNQGYSYAFSEAVRKRGDRMCLPGCTNPQCCGSTFRRMAEALDPLPAPQEEALLEEYLGDAYSTVICTQMSSDERAELVLQARTKKMAKDTGRHREAYERRRTPPGFWRVDFPTTQEQEEDRVRAKEQEATTVQERWLEAQRKGGKWTFRDE